MSRKAEKPRFTQMGNPYPPGLEPVVIDMTPIPGVPVERMWPRPLSEPLPKPDFSHMITTTEYRYERFEPGETRFKLRLHPRGEKTEKQYEHYRRAAEDHYHGHARYLDLCRALCTHLGNHRRCAETACRRKGRCASRRDEDRYTLPFAVFPPCVPLDLEIIETYRMEISRAIKRLRAQAAVDTADGK